MPAGDIEMLEILIPGIPFWMSSMFLAQGALTGWELWKVYRLFLIPAAFVLDLPAIEIVNN